MWCWVDVEWADRIMRYQGQWWCQGLSRSGLFQPSFLVCLFLQWSGCGPRTILGATTNLTLLDIFGSCSDCQRLQPPLNYPTRHSHQTKGKLATTAVQTGGLAWPTYTRYKVKFRHKNWKSRGKTKDLNHIGTVNFLILIAIKSIDGLIIVSCCSRVNNQSSARLLRKDREKNTNRLSLMKDISSTQEKFQTKIFMNSGPLLTSSGSVNKVSTGWFNEPFFEPEPCARFHHNSPV